MLRFSPNDLARWTHGTWHGTPPATLTAVSTDTRTIGPGSLFVALRGEKYDGHNFITDAIARGASAALVDTTFAEGGSTPDQTGGDTPLVRSKGPTSSRTDRGLVPLLQVPDTRRALRDLATGYRKSLAMQTIAVTGSAGKTTVKEMTADLLATAAPTARTRGNYNNDIGVPLSILATEPDTRYGIYEVGMNHPGELAPLCEIVKPAVSIITSVGPVHLEHFDNERAIADEKATVFRALKRTGRAILCRDEKWYDLLRDAAQCRVITTSLIGGADYVGKIAPDGSLNFTVTEKSTGDSVEFTAPLPGTHIIHDALLAIAAARHHRIPWPQLVTALANYQPAPMRWQRQEAHGITFINDCYNANPLSMTAALDAFASLKVAGRKIALLAGMGELGPTERELHEQIGRHAATKNFDALICIGERGAWIANAACSGRSASGTPEEGRSASGTPDEGRSQSGHHNTIHHFPDIETAIKHLRTTLHPGDTLLLKASRTEKLERIFEQFRAT